MGLDNIKKKLQQGPQSNRMTKPDRPKPQFSRIVIKKVGGKVKAVSEPISFEQWVKDMEEDTEQRQAMDEERNQEEEEETFHYRAPRPPSPGDIRREREHRINNIRATTALIPATWISTVSPQKSGVILKKDLTVQAR